MTARLRDEPSELDALIGQTATALGVPQAHVEKDFWVTEVLRVASVDREVLLPGGFIAPVTFTFKGGTSLSRVFEIVERFSEDVDLLVDFPPEATAQARHRVMRAVHDAVTQHLRLGEGRVFVESSTTGVKRYTSYHYQAAGRDESIREGVLLELGSRGGPFPSGSHIYHSLVARHAISVLGDTPSTWEEFAPFALTVLAPERTLFEKLAAVHDAASRNDTARLLRGGRHFYDIFRLLNDSRVLGALDAIGPDGVVDLVADIDGHSVAAEFTATKRPLHGYADSPAFDQTHSSFPAIAAALSAAGALIYGPMVSCEDVIAVVQAKRSLL